MNELLRMSTGGSSYFRRVNESGAERERKLARLRDLDLNFPPASDNVAPAAPSAVQPQQQSSDAPDDECLIISPRKFEEAVNNSQRNSSRRVRSHIEDFPEAGVAQSFDFLSTNLITLGISFRQLGTGNRVISLNDEVLNKTKDTATSVAMATTVPQSEPEAPTFSCVICMGQLVEETSTKCGHIFCKTCIETAIATQHKCPNCRRKLRKRDIFRVHLPYTS